MPPGFTRSLAERLNTRSALTVVEADGREPFRPGWAYVAPGGYHLVVRGQWPGEVMVRLDKSPPSGTLRPAADVTMASAAEVFGAQTVGVLLTGMGSDGTEGFRAIRRAGGETIVQNRRTSLVYGMPRMAAEQGLAGQVLPLNEIGGSDHGHRPHRAGWELSRGRRESRLQGVEAQRADSEDSSRAQRAEGLAGGLDTLPGHLCHRSPRSPTGHEPGAPGAGGPAG